MTRNFISFLHDEFSFEKVQHVDPHTTYRVTVSGKLRGGLWACPIDATYNWAKFCEVENFERGHVEFHFQVMPEANLLIVEDLIDVARQLDVLFTNPRLGALQLQDPRYPMYRLELNWHILLPEFDGLLVYASKPGLKSFFPTWDVDSLYLWNKEVIQPGYQLIHPITDWVLNDM